MFTVSQVRRRVYERKFDHDEAKELHAQGWPLADIARKCGVTPGAVRLPDSALALDTKEPSE